MPAIPAAETDDTAPARQSILLRSIAMLGLVGACIFLLAERLAGLDGAAVWEAFTTIPATAIAAALIFGGLSHLALAGYDLLALGRIGRSAPAGRALKGGFAGTVFSQVLGFGLITGSFARHRIYRANEISAPEAVAMSGFVAAGFFSGIFVLLCLLTALSPGLAAEATGMGSGLAQGLALGMLTLLTGFALIPAGVLGQARIFGAVLKAPDGIWLAKATALAAADLIPAALSLAILLPAANAPPLMDIVAIYVVAVALGHLAGSPGAIGPFETVIFLAMPEVPAAELAAAILVYRLVYYMPSFALAAGLVATASRKPDLALVSDEELPDRINWVLDESASAEAELALLGDKKFFFPERSRAFLIYAEAGRNWLVMGAPIGPAREWPALIEAFESSARAAGASIAIYKAPQAAMDAWRARGYAVQPLGEDAIIDATGFSLKGSNRRELRRKLASAQKAGVEIETHAPGMAPVERLAAVAEIWRAAKKGREQTFSMGHWHPAFLSRHVVIEALVEGESVAFISLWASGDGREWMLDLMRQRPDVPNGTMHSLIARAVEAAAEAGAERVNLCMAPMANLAALEPCTALSRLLDFGYRRFGAHHGLQGLRRFKEIFRPTWEPRYLLARSGFGIVEGLATAALLVNATARPEPLVAAPAGPDAREEELDRELDAGLDGAPPAKSDPLHRAA